MTNFQYELSKILFCETSTEELSVERVVELAIEIAPAVLEAACKQVDVAVISTRYIRDKCNNTIDSRYEAYRQGVEDTLTAIKGE